ncbi:MAG: aldo/keto reductase [Bacteroidia bacterium]|nr:aldo/keto reductase [Bacteroidia bacterium]NNC85685.1 aldo/keto reductase [Bacteroidia bacterium]NNM16115.1 aldo/keto reductase [Bacteroidia bacterium]
MEYRRLGKSGLQVSALSFGSWLTFHKKVDAVGADKLMTFAYDQGVNFFDNAEIYARGKSETLMGKILKKKKWDRSSYLVSSKVFFGLGDPKPNQSGLSRKHIVEGCNGALKRFQLDYLDLFYCHRPDKNVPIEETVWAMHNLVEQGKILYWGTSEWSAVEIMEAHRVASANGLIGPVMEQPQYNMFERVRVERDYSDIYRTVGLGTTIWSPLASGVLTGKYNSGIPKNSRLSIEGLDWLKDNSITKNRLLKVKKLSYLADKLGISIAQLAIAWCLKNQNVSTVILGASKISQLKENIRAIDVCDLLTEKVMANIDKILDNKPVMPSF